MMFVPLNVTSTYTLLKSPMTPKAYVKAGKKLGYSSLGLCDQNVLYGVNEFYQACQQEGIQPLIGLRVAFAIGQANQEEWIVYAQNYQGYQELMEISTWLKSTDSIEIEQERPFLLQNSRNCFLILDSVNGPHINYLKQNQPQLAEKFLEQFQGEKWNGRVYLGIDDQDTYYHSALRTLSKKSGCPLIAMPAVAYEKPGDYFIQRLLQAIDKNEVLEDYQHLAGESGGAFLKQEAAYLKRYQALGLEEAVENCRELANQCQVTLPYHQHLLPRYPLPEGVEVCDYLRQKAEEGLEDRHLLNLPVYKKRLDYELAVIDQMGFSDYFLIVWDVMAYAHRQKIMTGPGRGSAAGSLVAYALKITQVDPIANHLLFERFLNPERKNMPDIDLDFPDDKRQEIVEYVYRKYGSEHVAQISTFGTFQAKKALRDVGHTFGEDKKLIDQWAKTITGMGQGLRDAYQSSPQLQGLVNNHVNGMLWFKTACALEGLPHHVSTHAAGVLLSDKPLVETIPLQAGLNHTIHQSQFTMGEVEAIGLLKIDFLSLSNLTILANGIAAGEKILNQKLEPSVFPRDDQAVYQLFQEGDTLGIFQFESSGIRRVLKRVKPTNMSDLAAVNALYRPGPMQQIDEFVKRKHGQAPITYLHPDLEGILKETYGVMVYQEQVMQVAQKIAGFTLGEADLLRRAMSKKKHALIEQMKEKFVQQAKEKGYSQEKAEEIYHYIASFADYGFNKSHAYAYSYLAYQLAWLKVNLPAAFYYGILSRTKIYEEKGQALYQEAKWRGVTMEVPDVNQSYVGMQVKDAKTLQLGLSDIRAIPRASAYQLVQERLEGGRYKSLFDLMNRLDLKYIRKEVLEQLTLSGALDTFGLTRRTLIEEAIPKYIDHITLFGRTSDQQLSLPLFIEGDKQLYAPNIKELPEYDESHLRLGEQRTLGQALTLPLFQDYQPFYRAGLIQATSQLPVSQKVHLLLHIQQIKRIRTQKGQAMAFLQGDDGFGQIEVTVFPKAYIDYAALLHEGREIFLSGKVENRKGKKQVILQTATEVSQRLKDALKKQTSNQKSHLKKEKMYHIRVANRAFASQTKKQLMQLIQKNSGEYRINFTIQEEGKSYVLSDSYRLGNSSEILATLRMIYGKGNVLFL